MDRNIVETTTSDDRLFSMLIYLSSFFFPFLGPLLIWMFKRDQSAFVDYHGKEYFNFLIAFTVYGIISSTLILLLVGVVLVFVVAGLAFIFTIIAMIKSYKGEMYRFPLIFRLIK